ncbi:hypothetical protein DSECCO2_572960 [anaerobic digester metagenome]
MRHRDPLALDGVDTHGSGVEEDVHEVVVEQVHLVDIEDPPVGGGKETRFERPDPSRNRSLQVDRADHPILGGTDGQGDHANRARLGLRGSLRCPASLAPLLRTGGIAREGAPDMDLLGGEDFGECPHGRGLGRPLLTPDEHPADTRIDRVQHQGLLHQLLPDYRRERKQNPGVPLTHRRRPPCGS